MPENRKFAWLPTVSKRIKLENWYRYIVHSALVVGQDIWIDWLTWELLISMKSKIQPMETLRLRGKHRISVCTTFMTIQIEVDVKIKSGNEAKCCQHCS